MRTYLVSCAAFGLTTGLFLTGPPPAAAVRYSDGPATMTFDACATKRSVGYVDGCSYLYLKPAKEPGYTFLTSPGAVSWQGALSGSTLTFPTMTWPTLKDLALATNATFTTSIAAGTIDSTGRLQLPLEYSVVITVFSDRCTLSGTAQLSSDGVEWLSGAAPGRAYDPRTGRFAVASTGSSPVTATGDCDAVGRFAYDLTAGAGWYLTGTLTIPPPGPDQPQTAAVKTPDRIKARGKTVLLPAAVVTDAGQTAAATVTWSKRKKAGGSNRKWARVTYATSGKVTLRTSGKAKRLYVRLRLHASAVEGYSAYDFTRTWRVRAR